MFPESDILREQLQDSSRTRLKSLIPSALGQDCDKDKRASYTRLLDVDTIATNKSQILFLYLLVS